MLPLLLLFAAGGLWTSLPMAERLGPVAGTLIPVVVCVALATAASGRPTALATMVGALAAFLGSAAWSLLPALGGATILAIAYADRTSRVRPLRARIGHAVLTGLAGGAAGALTATYTDGVAVYRGVAIVMGSVLSLLPLVIMADDPRVGLLEGAARRLGQPLAEDLIEGVELLRCGDPSLLDRETSRNLRKSWASLERLLEARLAMLDGPSPRKSDTAAMVTHMLDRQITEHVATLTRAYTAVTTMGAAEVGIDDSAMREAHARGEALDEQSRAIVEVTPH